MITALAKAGADVFRLNCAHSDHESLAKTVHLIRKVAKKLNQPIGILADLQGPKIRVGALKGAEPIWLASDQPFIISTAPGVVGEGPKGSTPTRVGTSYERLARDVKPKERILLDDGNIEVVVEKVRGTEVHTRVVYGGLLKQFKGINLPGSEVSAPTLSRKDLDDLQAVLKLGVDFVALSFVRTAKDVRMLAKLIAKAKSDAQIISKIERPEAVTNFEEILEASYGVMVARGDMGVELGPEAVPALQKRIIAESLAASKPVITATQMLESMITNPRPTRAEASDVANAIYDGTSAIMLSAETASGKHPVRAVEIMSSIARRTEEDIFTNQRYNLNHSPRPAAINTPLATVRAAAYGAVESGARLIAIFTESGATARHLAGERISTRFVAFTPYLRTVQRLALSWGINPRQIARHKDTEEMVDEGIEVAKHDGYVSRGDRVVVVFGTTRQSGLTNTMKIRDV
jgi:pyruvate kinase